MINKDLPVNINISSNIENNFNNRITMKLKLVRITSIVIVSLLLGGGITSQAQGIFDASSNEKSADNKEHGNPVFFKDDDPFGDNGGQGGNGPGGDDGPIGGGIAVLSVLSGAYAFIKRNGKRKHEN